MVCSQMTTGEEILKIGRSSFICHMYNLRQTIVGQDTVAFSSQGSKRNLPPPPPPFTMFLFPYRREHCLKEGEVISGGAEVRLFYKGNQVEISNIYRGVPKTSVDDCRFCKQGFLSKS